MYDFIFSKIMDSDIDSNFYCPANRVPLNCLKYHTDIQIYGYCKKYIDDL